MFNMVRLLRGVSAAAVAHWLMSAFCLMANTLTTLTHPAGQTAGTSPMAGIGTAPTTVIGAFTKTVYTVSSNAISNVDTRDLIPLLHAGWV